MRQIRFLALVTILSVLAHACGGEEDAATLERFSLSVPDGADAILVSLPLAPNEHLQVVGVTPQPGPRLDATYLGYVTTCGGLCGVHAWEPHRRTEIQDAVEGTTPFELVPETGDTHLLFVLEPTAAGRRHLDAGECLSILSVDLEVAGRERPIRVTRKDFGFLWVVGGEDADCVEQLQFLS